MDNTQTVFNPPIIFTEFPAEFIKQEFYMCPICFESFTNPNKATIHWKDHNKFNFFDRSYKRLKSLFS